MSRSDSEVVLRDTDGEVTVAQNAAKNAASPQAAPTMTKTTNKAAPLGVQCPCPNKAEGCRRESPNRIKIDMVEEVQELMTPQGPGTASPRDKKGATPPRPRSTALQAN